MSNQKFSSPFLPFLSNFTISSKESSENKKYVNSYSFEKHKIPYNFVLYSIFYSSFIITSPKYNIKLYFSIDDRLTISFFFITLTVKAYYPHNKFPK